MRFEGKKTPEGVVAYFRAADVFVLVSLEETVGLPVLEALGYGAPVVLGKCPGNEIQYFNPFEEVCGEAAIYCNPLDAPSIAEGNRNVSEKRV